MQVSLEQCNSVSLLCSIKSEYFLVLSIWDYPQKFEIEEEGVLPGFVLSIDLQRYPDFYIYNIIIPVQ